MIRFSFDVQPFVMATRKFAHVRLVSETTSIGNFEESVLLESLELSLVDLVARLSRDLITIDDHSHECEAVFSALYAAAWNGEVEQLYEISQHEYSVADARNCIALPTAVEAFDGELAFLYQTSSAHSFVWRDWESKSLKFSTIDKASYLEELKLALSKIQANQQGSDRA